MFEEAIWYCYHYLFFQMPVVACPIRECNYTTPDLDAAIVAALLTTHSTMHTPSSTHSSKPPTKSQLINPQPTLYSCLIKDCRYTGNSKKGLSQHMRRHNNERKNKNPPTNTYTMYKGLKETTASRKGPECYGQEVKTMEDKPSTSKGWAKKKKKGNRFMGVRHTAVWIPN